MSHTYDLSDSHYINCRSTLVNIEPTKPAPEPMPELLTELPRWVKAIRPDSRLSEFDEYITDDMAVGKWVACYKAEITTPEGQKFLSTAVIEQDFANEDRSMFESRKARVWDELYSYLCSSIEQHRASYSVSQIEIQANMFEINGIKTDYILGVYR